MRPETTGPGKNRSRTTMSCTGRAPPGRPYSPRRPPYPPRTRRTRRLRPSREWGRGAALERSRSRSRSIAPPAAGQPGPRPYGRSGALPQQEAHERLGVDLRRRNEGVEEAFADSRELEELRNALVLQV